MKQYHIWKSVIIASMLLGTGGVSLPVWASPQEEGWPANSMTAGEFLAESKDDTAYAIADVNSGLRIREGAGTEYPVVGELPPDGLCHVEEMAGEWAYITSGDIAGYVYASYLIDGLDGNFYVDRLGEEQVLLAYHRPEEADGETEEESPGEQPAFSMSTDSLREQIVDYALQFVGNPYVWGGTSLTEGADCSGFVQSVYEAFGITIPRVSKEQSAYGEPIAVEDAKPGDLIFYAKDGEIYHVVLYIGNGQVVHASSPQTGIKVSDVAYSQAVWAISLPGREEGEVLS